MIDLIEIMTQEDLDKLAAAGIMYPPNTAEEYAQQIEAQARAQVEAARAQNAPTWPPAGSLDLFCPKPKPPAPPEAPRQNRELPLRKARLFIMNALTGAPGVSRPRLYQMIESGLLPRRADDVTGQLFLLDSDIEVFNLSIRHAHRPPELSSDSTTSKKSAA